MAAESNAKDVAALLLEKGANIDVMDGSMFCNVSVYEGGVYSYSICLYMMCALCTYGHTSMCFNMRVFEYIDEHVGVYICMFL